MKIVILCGGLGSRLSEETKIKPKPMVKIGNKPILSHIIGLYENFGFKLKKETSSIFIYEYNLD